MMHQLLGSLRLEKCNARGSCMGNTRARHAKEGHNGDMEDDTAQEVEYVPATYLQGKYVLLYLHDPTGSGIDAQKPTTAPVLPSPPLSTGHSSLSQSPPATCGTSTAAKTPQTSVAFTATRPMQNEDATTAGNSRVQTRIKSLLYTFCGSLIRQLEAASSQEGNTVCPVAIFEVRQPNHTDNLSPSAQPSDEQPAVATAAATAPAEASTDGRKSSGSDDGKDAASLSPTKVVGAGSVFIESSLGTEPVSDTVVNSSPFFAGWFSLESAAAYRQVVQTFSVTSWPLVLLFDPFGKLLTSRTLDHIEREREFTKKVGDQLLSLPVSIAGAKAERHAAEFHLRFPWVAEEAEIAGGAVVGRRGNTFPFLPLLRRVVQEARRVGDLLDDEAAIAQPETEADEERKEDEADDKWNASLEGATHLALYFGSGWHPASGRFLPRLRRLWLTVNEGNDGSDSDGDDDDDDEKAGTWGMSSKALNMFGFGGFFSSASQGLLSYQMGAFGDHHDITSVLESEPLGFSSKCSSPKTTPHSSPKRKGFDMSSPLTLPERLSSLKAPHEFPTYEQHQEDEEEKNHQAPRLTRFQVVCISCDSEREQLCSLLSDAPSSWLCISSVFGPSQNALVEACLEAFDVHVFPRLVVVETGRKNDLSWSSSEVSQLKPSSDTTVNVVLARGEEPILRGSNMKKFPWKGEEWAGAPELTFSRPVVSEISSRGNCSSLVKRIIAEGGSLFVLCGTGRVAAKLHQACLAALHESGAWWSQEIERLAKLLVDCEMSATEWIAGGANRSESGQHPGEYDQEAASDIDAPVATGAAAIVGATKLGFDARELFLPVCIYDVIIEEHKDKNAGDDSKQRITNRSNSDDSSDDDDDALKEEKAMLQEYVLSEVLEENEHLLPPVEGEPFLACLQWPDRRAAVLRRKFDFEASSVLASFMPLQTSCSAATATSCSPGSLPPGGTAPAAEVRTAGAMMWEPLVECGSGRTSLSETLRLEPSPDPYVANPLCSAAHVKAFIAKHALQRCR
ncbi:hypothetical protein DQ04_00341130 [Trypanosoma grayi]|uniref:hypothetical protein n=1 Tax=Trypanosoma grayi TaxID=71804 RepID=UPI0004F3FB10|nr:hypothetical protein DQ04_00341130 [Trypanosoma grayi]KEG14698.1 hypothetical protein DQ04_00341130 [Trypanosoma grayi]